MTAKNYLMKLKNKLIEKETSSNDLSKYDEYLSKASEIGKIIVNKCLAQDIYINTQKLQKLLVLVQIECIKDSGFPLFSQNIEYWECGVAIKEVDKEFRQYALGFNKYLNEKIVLLYSEMQYIDNIINQYASLTPYDLNELCLLNKDILTPFASKQKCKIYK